MKTKPIRLCPRAQLYFRDGKKNPLKSVGFLYGALGRIRTSDRSVRSRVLYPAELRVRVEAHYTHFFRLVISNIKLKTKKNPLKSVGSLYGALGRIRTSDRSVRSRVLYPAELRVRVEAHYTHFFRLVISNIKLKTKKNPLKSVGSLYGALGRIRTSDRSVRSRVLYPAELRVRVGANYRLFYRAVKCFFF